ncbi:MAG: hypothetical protein Q8K23_10160, partial [Sulfuritalea sp.]|nr:hypothetical protein [Sulfuritalea sp.]
PDPNPKFHALAARLVRRYPDLNGMPSPEGDEEASVDDLAWADGEISGESDDAVLNLGLNTARLDEVQPFVVAEANALGLCVMDEQAGKVFLTGGSVLAIPGTETQAVAPKDKYADVPKTRELAKSVAEHLTPMLQRHGYKARKGSLRFKRSFPGGWSEIEIGTKIDDWPLNAEFQVYGVIAFDQVNELNVQLKKSVKRYEDRQTAVATLEMWMDDSDQERDFLAKYSKKYTVRSYSEVDAMIEHLSMKLETRLIPLLKQCETVAGLDEVLNPTPPARSLLGGFDRGEFDFLAAYLARNPRLESMIEQRSRAWSTEPYLLSFIDYVRANPLK